MIKATKIKTKYSLSDGQYEIYPTVHSDGRISIESTYKRDHKFLFEHCEPEVLEHIGKLISESHKLKI